MKPTGDSARFCAAPPSGLVGALLYGEDSAVVADRRRALLARLLGPGAAEEMRLTQLSAAEVRSDPGRLDVELRARGFFAGARAVAIIGATDGLAPIIGAALAHAASPDSFLLATADALTGKSALRRLFEDARNAAAVPCASPAMDGETVAALLRAAGAPEPDETGRDALEAAARDLGPGAFARLVETLALYRLETSGPLLAADVAALVASGDGAVDEALDAVLEGRPAAVRAQFSRLTAQGVGAVEICLAASRRFKALHALAARGTDGARTAPGWGGGARFGFGPGGRDAAARHARRWGVAALERALGSLLETDAGLRGGSNAPGQALLERTLLRLASEAQR